jgi:hypothetical protein
VEYCLERVPALVKANPELANVEPFKTVMSGDREGMAKLSTADHSRPLRISSSLKGALAKSATYRNLLKSSARRGRDRMRSGAISPARLIGWVRGQARPPSPTPLRSPRMTWISSSTPFGFRLKR